MVIDMLKVVIGGFIGAILGSFLAHRFTSLRDRAIRKRNFRGFLEEWRAIVEQTDTRDIPAHYFEYVRSFRREAERVRGDFKSQSKFSDHVIALGHMTPDAIRGDGTKASRDILADAITTFRDFARTHYPFSRIIMASKTRARPNGWVRIGIVLSIGWMLFMGGVATIELLAHNPSTSNYIEWRGAKTGEDYASLKKSSGEFVDLIPLAPSLRVRRFLPNVFVPIALFWTISYTVIYTIRWIVRGFHSRTS
jgi:hypothetical protein